MTSGKWRIVGIVILAAGLAAALPFQRSLESGGSLADRSETEIVWRRPESAAPAKPMVGSPVEELFIHALAEETTTDQAVVPQIRRPALDCPSTPPELPAVYVPLIESVTRAGPSQTSVSADGQLDETEERVVRHRIVDGDTLARLAARYLGSDTRWPEIYAENRDVLASPDLLPIDGELVIVVRPANSPQKSSGSSSASSDLVPIE